MIQLRTTLPTSLALLSTALVGLPGLARADEASAPQAALTATADRWADRPWLASVQLGLGGPAGAAAVELERTLGTPYLSVAFGAGESSGANVQLAGTLRGRLPVARWFAVGLGAGLSFGDHHVTDFNIGHSENATLDGVTWGNGELYLEARNGFGISARLFGGYSHQLGAGACHPSGLLEATGCRDFAGDDLPYGGAAVGYAF